MFREQTLLGWMFVLTNFKIAKLRGGGTRKTLLGDKNQKNKVRCVVWGGVGEGVCKNNESVI